ncbi:response regulator transcription factor [Blastococcus brunescens]|uniref:Response regulator transcription factor n=1 Tax=Blastococcus brunescens TaxID=1564165 RepID=A0ABZ1B0I8_9ACTN|nr:response regulator transcription factor [Blastococcus sp. BMG 8361]WRL64331.1 response regulator transcription factor [Blastococcus sp. BMG 8361]
MTRLLLADDHRSFVEVLAVLLGAEPDLQVVAVSRPDEALRVGRSGSIDVAVLAVDGAGGDYLSTGEALLAARPDIRLVAVAQGCDVATLARVLRTGFRAWVPKAEGVDALLDAVAAVLRGETHVPPLLLTELLAHLFREEAEVRTAETRLAALSTRERQVLEAMAHGWSGAEIAEELAISPNTVRTHTQNILAKLDLHTSLAAVALARRAGIAGP